jgi:hypothetical protein
VMLTFEERRLLVAVPATHQYCALALTLTHRNNYGVSIPRGFVFRVGGGALSGSDRYGADCNNKKSALSALYLAARRLVSEPCMTTTPSDVQTRQLHFRRRLSKTTS